MSKIRQLTAAPKPQTPCPLCLANFRWHLKKHVIRGGKVGHVRENKLRIKLHERKVGYNKILLVIWILVFLYDKPEKHVVNLIR